MPDELRVNLYEQHGETSIFLAATTSSGGDFEMAGQDIGRAPQEVWGHEDYEYTVSVSAAEKDRLLLAFVKKIYGGDPMGTSHLMEFLEAEGIPFSFSHWP
jgi:hypothetical protein